MPEDLSEARSLHRRGDLEGARRLYEAAPAEEAGRDDALHLLGLIAALFPGSRIIHCVRDPRDVALSCWLTNFGQLRWACDPGHIASRIVDSARLMDRRKSSLPVAILEVAYEAVDDDLEGKARELVAWCGLDWDPACLDFHSTRRPVQTTSAFQVRRPIYRGSIGRWKNYERPLAPLFSGLS